MGSTLFTPYARTRVGEKCTGWASQVGGWVVGSRVIVHPSHNANTSIGQEQHVQKRVCTYFHATMTSIIATCRFSSTQCSLLY